MQPEVVPHATATTAILLHGCCDAAEFYGVGPSSSNSHWLPWLQKQLLLSDIETQTPEMPTPFKPQYAEWRRVMGCFPLTSESMLVGHSCGGGFMLRWLLDTKIHVKKLALVAPWIDPYRVRKDFLNFELDRSLASQIDQIALFHSTNDVVEGVSESMTMLKTYFTKASCFEFADRGHFTFADMRTPEFPELREWLLS